VLFGVPDVYPDFNTISADHTMHFNSNWTRVLSANRLNETSFSWGRVYGNLPLNRPDIPGIQVTGIRALPDHLGTEPTSSRTTFEFRDVVTLDARRAYLKSGGEYSRGHASTKVACVRAPIYTFNSVFDFAPTRHAETSRDRSAHRRRLHEPPPASPTNAGLGSGRTTGSEPNLTLSSDCGTRRSSTSTTRQAT